MMVELSGN